METTEQEPSRKRQSDEPEKPAKKKKNTKKTKNPNPFPNEGPSDYEINVIDKNKLEQKSMLSRLGLTREQLKRMENSDSDSSLK